MWAIGMKDSAKAIQKVVERSRVNGAADDMMGGCSLVAFYGTSLI